MRSRRVTGGAGACVVDARMRLQRADGRKTRSPTFIQTKYSPCIDRTATPTSTLALVVGHPATGYQYHQVHGQHGPNMVCNYKTQRSMHHGRANDVPTQIDARHHLVKNKTLKTWAKGGGSDNFTVGRYIRVAASNTGYRWKQPPRLHSSSITGRVCSSRTAAAVLPSGLTRATIEVALFA